MVFFLCRYISHPRSASISTPTAAPMPMPALAPALRDAGDDPFVLMEGGTIFGVLACWPVEVARVDDRPLDDGSVVFMSTICN